MSENRFAAYTKEVLSVEEEELRITAARESDRTAQLLRTYTEAQELTEINIARADTNEGSNPEDLWGSEVAEICNDFIDFAVNISVGYQYLLGSQELRGKDITERYQRSSTGIFIKKPIFSTRLIEKGWRSRGYAIAYSDPKKLTGTSVDATMGIIPECDVMLCVDGLIRVGVHPIEQINLNGLLKIPKFGVWNMDKSVRYWEDVEINGAATFTHKYSETKYTRTFIDENPITGINTVLGRHAVNMARIQKTV